MPARVWNNVVLMTVMVMGTSGALIPAYAEVKEQMRTFDLDHIIDLALERNPAILGAQSVIQQNEGRQVQAGAYPNPTIGGNTGRGAIQRPQHRDKYERVWRDTASDGGMAGHAGGP